MVTKLRLTSLNELERSSADFSAIGTTGAIVGTVVTGFILISRLPVSGIMVGLGAVLVGAAAWSSGAYAAGGRRSLQRCSSSSAAARCGRTRWLRRGDGYHAPWS